MSAIVVSAGAMMGALTRWQLTEVSKKYGSTYWGTAAINCTGSCLLGAVISHQQHSTSRPMIAPSTKHLYLLCGTGFCGSFTTFSTFSVDTVLLLESGLLAQALRLALVTNVCSIGAAALGFKAMKLALK